MRFASLNAHHDFGIKGINTEIAQRLIDILEGSGLDHFDFNPTTYAARHAAWLAGKIDCTGFLTYFIENYPNSIEEVKTATPDFWTKFK